MPGFVVPHIFYSIQFFIPQYVISLKQQQLLNIPIERLHIPYHRLRPGFRRNDIYKNLASFRGIRHKMYLARTQRFLPNGKRVVRVTDTPI